MVIIDVLLGDEIPLSVKVEAIVAAGAEIVVCSGVTSPGLIRQAYQAGARAVVPKTSGAKILSEAVLAAARGEQTVPSELSAVFPPIEASIRLTAREHEAVSLCLGEGLTMVQAGERLGISANGIKKLLVSARRKAGQGQESLSRLAFRDRLVTDGWLQPDHLPAPRNVPVRQQGPEGSAIEPEPFLV